MTVVGILVHGNNHFILSGPTPDETEALRLVWHLSVTQIGEKKLLQHEKWQIRTKEFRENLEWAVVVPGDGEISAGEEQLLKEISTRGVKICTYHKS
jgi:hypothetical protein